jgi:starvation-inducible DNA-binding protein
MKAKKPARIDIGISDADRAKIAKGLSHLLADSYTLYLMTHNFHWNVTGPMFNTLHLMFMGQYTEQWNALDIIAERIRALGHRRRHLQGIRQTRLDQGSGRRTEGHEMIRLLVDAQKRRHAPRALFPLLDKANDQPTADVLTQRLDT